MSPPYAIETDSSHKLVKLVDPTADGDDITASYLEKQNNSKTITKQNLYFAARTGGQAHHQWMETRGRDPQRRLLPKHHQRQGSLCC